MSIAHVYPVENGTKFACYLNNECVALSKQADYVETHYREGDVKRINALHITSFTYYNANNEVVKNTDAISGVPVQKSLDNQPYLSFLNPGYSKLSIEPLTEDGALINLRNDKPKIIPLDSNQRKLCQAEFKRLRLEDQSIEECIVFLMNRLNTSRTNVYDVISKMSEF